MLLLYIYLISNNFKLKIHDFIFRENKILYWFYKFLKSVAWIISKISSLITFIIIFI